MKEITTFNDFMDYINISGEVIKDPLISKSGETLIVTLNNYLMNSEISYSLEIGLFERMFFSKEYVAKAIKERSTTMCSCVIRAMFDRFNFNFNCIQYIKNKNIYEYFLNKKNKDATTVDSLVFEFTPNRMSLSGEINGTKINILKYVLSEMNCYYYYNEVQYYIDQFNKFSNFENFNKLLGSMSNLKRDITLVISQDYELFNFNDKIDIFVNNIMNDKLNTYGGITNE